MKIGCAQLRTIQRAARLSETFEYDDADDARKFARIREEIDLLSSSLDDDLTEHLLDMLSTLLKWLRSESHLLMAAELHQVIGELEGK